MALIARKAFLEAANPILQAKRFRGKINIQRPKPPHYERAKFIEITRPWFTSRKIEKTQIDICEKQSKTLNRSEVENPFQNIVAGELRRWLTESRLVAFFHMNPMTGEEQYKAYVLFHKESMHFKNYGRKTLHIAVKGTKYEPLLDFYHSHNMTVFSPEADVRKMLKITKKVPQLVLLAAIYEGQLLDKAKITDLSKYSNLQAAQVQLVSALNSAASTLHQQLNSHQSTLVSQLQERIKQLGEK